MCCAAQQLRRIPCARRLLKCRGGCVTGARYPCAICALFVELLVLSRRETLEQRDNLFLHFWYKHMRMPCNVTFKCLMRLTQVPLLCRAPLAYELELAI